MISLTCTNAACQSVLTIDDAFAGGVCRCQHCGTIQTVPKKSALAAGATTGSSKTLYQQRGRAADGTGLEQLADVVSSGLSGSGLSGTGKKKAPAAGRNTTLLAIAGAVIVLLVLVIFLMMRSSGPGTGSEGPSATSGPPSEAASTGGPIAGEPEFAGIRLTGQTVIFVIDRGSSTQNSFGDLKEATLRAATLLGSGRRFQIIFWNNGSDLAYPTSGPLFATRETVDSARRALEDAFAFGQTDARPALEKAFKSSPDEIVLATSKEWDLGPEFTQMVMDVRGSSPARVHAVAVGNSGGEALKTIAANTGGKYVQTSESALRETHR